MKGTHGSDYSTPDLLLPESFSGLHPTHEKPQTAVKNYYEELICEAVVFQS